MEIALPASVDFSRRQPELPDSTTSTLMSISPNNGLSFGPGQQITFDLPSRPGLFIDGKSVFIRYKVTYTSGATAGVIRRKPVYTNFARLDEYIGGVPVNSVNQYNQVANMWTDINCNISDVYGQQFSYGLSQTAAFLDVDGVTLATTSGTNDFYVAAPLVCSFLQGTDKLYPTGSSAPIRVQLTVDSIYNIAVVAANVTAITISQPELCFSVVDMGVGVQQMIEASSPQLFIKTRAWANGTQGAANNTSGQQSLVYNHRYASIENLFFLSTPTDATKGLNLWGDSLNPMGNATTSGNIQFSVGNQQFPQLPIYNLTGGRASVQQYLRECTGQIADQRNTMAIFNQNFNYFPDVSGTNTTADVPAKFIIGVPLSRLNPPSPYQTTSLLAGMSAQSTPITVNLLSGTAFTSAMQFNLIAEYSQLIVIDTMSKQVSVVA
jgi:hypothetical protein